MLNVEANSRIQVRMGVNLWHKNDIRKFTMMQHEMESQIHYLEQIAYSSVLQAFRAQSDALSWVLLYGAQVISWKNERREELLFMTNEELFSAGTDSMGSTTEWFVAELLRNQQVMQKVRDEVMQTVVGNVVKESDLVRLPFLVACLKETLRLHPPGPLLLPHRATQKCEMMGYTIPKDSQILVNMWAIGRDPSIWDDPLSFKPERFIGSKLSYKGKDFEYLPFSAGRRMCPGEALASKTILMVVASMVLNFDWFLVNNMNPEYINMEEVLDVAMHKKEPLHVIYKTRE